MDVERLEQVHQFLERAKRASATYEDANPDEKRDLVREVFLELGVHDEKVVSRKLTEAFEPIVIRDNILYGGPDEIRTRDLFRDREAL